ncbi:hypothetical protein LINPERPRIM_LOCUS24999, partial [Linum perenne]
ELGYKRVEIQSDSIAAIQIFENHYYRQHQHVGTVMKFKKLLERDWVVSLVHIYREGTTWLMPLQTWVTREVWVYMK